MSRLLVLRVCVLLVMTIMVGRLYQLQLVDSETKRYDPDLDISTSRFVTIEPRRGEIYANDGKTLLAESVPIYNLAVIPGRLPDPDTAAAQRATVLGEVSQIAALTSTLTLSPSTALQRPGLRANLQVIVPDLPPADQLAANQPLTLTVPIAQTLPAIALTQVHSDVLTFNNPIEVEVNRFDVRRYQTVNILEDVPHTLALSIEENSTHLPGVVIVESYRRRYPDSANLMSLSHILGHVGRISECELVSENPSTTWFTSLVDVVSHAGNCGLIPKQIAPPQIGIPPYQNSDRIGKDGLEARYETILRGGLGVDTLRVDARERPVSALSTFSPVRDGNNLTLTIDTTFQRETEQILRSWIDEGERRRLAATGHKRDYKPITNGTVVALDPRDGRVLAMVSLPTYDNNIWVDPQRQDELVDLLAPQDPARREEIERLAPLTNRAVAGQYPAGSTLKEFVGAVALQMGVIQPDTKLRDPGELLLTERSGITFRLPNSVRRDNGWIDVAEALRISSNVFFASIAGGNDQATNLAPDDYRVNGLNIDRLAEGLEWFGFGRQTDIDLAGEAPGLIPSKTWKAQTLREAWTTGDTYNTAIGQGYLQVTPLQLADATGAVATDGTVYVPQLVQAVTDGNGDVVAPFSPKVHAKVPVDPAYLAVIRRGMRLSVSEGLNIAAQDACSGLSIAGKTGTAEFGPILTTAEGKPTRQSHSWFVGFAPYDDPQIVVAVLLEGTGDLGDGSSTLAVPAVTQVMQAYFNTTPPEAPPATCPVLPPLPVIEPAPATGN